MYGGQLYFLHVSLLHRLDSGQPSCERRISESVNSVLKRGSE